MKIMVISSTVFPCPPSGYSGLEFLAWQIAKGLAAKGHEVTLTAPDGSWAPGCQAIPTGPAGQHGEDQAFEKYRQAVPGFDAVIDHSWAKMCYLDKERFEKSGKKYPPVLSVMHAPVNTMIGSLPPVDKPCFVGISQDMCDHFKALFGGEMRRAYNGVDIEAYRPLGAPRSGRFLFLARFSRIKGALLAIDACIKAGVRLDLVGDTSITNEPDYFEACRRKCDGEQIRMVGPASRGNCVWWFSRAHALLHPIKEFREPFGLAPVEALLCGAPVIAWRNGAMPETIGPGCGWLVNSEKSLTEAVSQAKGSIDPAMRKRCRDWAVRFSEQAMIDRYEELCKEAVEGEGW